MAVSAFAKESALNTAQTLDLSLLADMSDVIKTDYRREDNADDMTGYEEPDTVYDLGKTASAKMAFKRAQPQHFAFVGAYCLGAISSASLGSGYRHTITPIESDLDAYRSNPSFTMAMRYGRTIAKNRHYSMFVDQMTATLKKDDWIKLDAVVKGTGKYDSTLTEESITAAENATSLTLAANAVHGATAAERLDSVHRIRVLLSTSAWTEVEYSAVSSATPAVISITAPGGTSTPRTYKVLYSPTEPAWATFPARVNETPLRLAAANIRIGGRWNGSSFLGGRQLRAEMNQLTWAFNNNLDLEFTPTATVGDETGAFANRVFRPNRTQKVTIESEFRDYVQRSLVDNNETFGIQAVCYGGYYDQDNTYRVDLIFPKVAIVASDLADTDRRLAETSDLLVLRDDTYGSVILRVQNLQSVYMA
jgi:hypothetical protein